MPDSVLPPPETKQANGAPPRMGTPHQDTSWSGWAISSFTNKLAGASGDIQTKPSNANTGAMREKRPSSVPPADKGRVSRLPPGSSASDISQTTLPVPTITKSSSEHILDTTPTPTGEDTLDDSWDNTGEDTFFGAFTTASPALTSPTAFDDGGEPDFAGWLNAQHQAKSKAPLPKGISRPPASGGGRASTANRPPAGTSAGLGAKRAEGAVKKPTTVTLKTAEPTKAIDTKPKEAVGDDDWGDAWD
jgi:SCY1-like protein 1